MKDTNPDFGEPALQSDESEARHQWISEDSCYTAEKRGFAPGLELDDWLAAEKNYFEMLISSYLSIMEEDDAITVASLQQLAKKMGIQNPESLKFKDDLIRAIQDISGTRPCFQLYPTIYVM
jgi:hypothetical protein